MPSVFGLPPDAFCLHLAAESSRAIPSNVLLLTPVSRRNASPFSSLTESNLIAAPLWRQRIKPWLIEGYARGLLLVVRWQARDRKIPGPRTPQGSACHRLPFHRTRTVAWAGYEARLRKDGIRWTSW